MARPVCISTPSAPRHLGRTFAESRHVSISNNSCPSCGYRFSWIERAKSSRCLGFARRIVKCPGCGADVMWAQGPWRMAIGGATVGLLMLAPGILIVWEQSFELPALCWAVLTLGAQCVSAAGVCTLHFVGAGTANQHLQAAPR
jgi:hypothetical protein